MTVRVAVLDDYQEVARSHADWTRLPDGVEVQVFTKPLGDTEAAAEQLAAFPIIVAMRERTAFPRALLRRLPELRLLVTTGTRNAAIDLDAAEEYGVLVSGTAMTGSSAPELTWALILALARHVPAEDRAMREGHWQHTVGTDLAGKTLGVLGLGRIGRQIAAVGQAFGMNVVAWSANLTPAAAADVGVQAVSELDELLRNADVVTVHSRLSDRTDGLIGAEQLRVMKSTALLVNTSRGPIVDEEALLTALHEGRIGGAALDVYGTEPLPADHPLRDAPRTVLTPHIGYVTRESYQVAYGEAVEDIEAFLNGKPIRLLTSER